MTIRAARAAVILLVEDDPSIRLGLQELLGGEGFEVYSCERGDEAIGGVKQRRPDLIVLDVMLPGISGFDICRELRSNGCTTPILMLTAKGQELDKVIGLDSGADDYVTKPFGVRELVARVHALLRRSDTSSTRSNGVFQVGGCSINPKTFTLERDGQCETLTAKELNVLQFMHAHAGEVLSRERLLSEVWGYDYFGTTRTLDQVIAQLRRKLGEGSPPQNLLTVHGVGYRLAGNSTAGSM